VEPTQKPEDSQAALADWRTALPWLCGLLVVLALLALWIRKQRSEPPC